MIGCCILLHKHETASLTHGAASTCSSRANPELGPVTSPLVVRTHFNYMAVITVWNNSADSL